MGVREMNPIDSNTTALAQSTRTQRGIWQLAFDSRSTTIFQSLLIRQLAELSSNISLYNYNFVYTLDSFITYFCFICLLEGNVKYRDIMFVLTLSHWTNKDRTYL